MKDLKTLKEDLSEYLYITIKPFHYLLNKLNNLLNLKLEIYVIGSGLSSSLERYSLIASGCTLAATLITAFTVFLYTYSATKLPTLYLVLVSFLIAPLIAILTSTVFTIAVPRILYSSRGSVVESKAILLLTAISLLISGGYSIQNLFDNIEKALGRDYRYFSIEIDLMKSLLRIGTPLDVALKRVAEISPSPTIKEMLVSLASLSNIGGDIPSSIRQYLDQYIARYEATIGRAVEDLNVYMEVYIALALLLPVLIGSIAVLTLIYPMAGISFGYIMFLSSFILLPVSTLVIVVLSDMIVSRIRP